MRTGRYSSAGEPTESSHDGTIEGIADPAFDATAEFHEMGFEWSADVVRFFYSNGGEELSLWRMEDLSLVPTPPASFYFNAWHARYVWFVSQALFESFGSWEVPAFYPASDAGAFVDWFEYEES